MSNGIELKTPFLCYKIVDSCSIILKKYFNFDRLLNNKIFYI